jgi:hypothetical protein
MTEPEKVELTIRIRAERTFKDGHPHYDADTAHVLDTMDKRGMDWELRHVEPVVPKTW